MEEVAERTTNSIVNYDEDSSQNLQPHSRESPVSVQETGHGEQREQEGSNVKDPSHRIHRPGPVLEGKLQSHEEVSVVRLCKAAWMLLQNTCGEHQ